MNTMDFNPLDFAGKKIMITGASSGIGREASIYLSKLGARIVLVGRNTERLMETLGRLDGTGHLLYSVDLAETEDLKELFDYAVKDDMKLSGLIHSAGITNMLPVRSMKRKHIHEVMDIHFAAFMELVKQYAKPKYSAGGAIVGISSIAAEQGEKCISLYAAAKAAMNAAVQALSIELSEKNIRINTVMPGMVQTELLAVAGSNGSDTAELAKQQLLGIGRPEQIASVCAFLLSDMSSFITGRKLFVDGGRFL